MSINDRSDIEKKREAFWNGYSTFLFRNNESIKVPDQNSKGYINSKHYGKKQNLSARVKFGRKSDNVQALIDLPSDKCAFSVLESNMSEIEHEFGEKLRWEKAYSRWNILVGIDVDLCNQDNWEDAYQWLMEQMVKLEQVFCDRIQAL